MVETGWYEPDGMNLDGMNLDGMNRMAGTHPSIPPGRAEVCMKKEDQPFCERLKCARDHWQLTDGKSSSNTQEFWDDHVKGELGKLLSDTTTGNGGSTDHCENGPSMDSANKEACKHMTKYLNQMYQNANGGTKGLSDQIIKCALLKEYAKKLKDEAKNRGYCDINEGISHAFNQSNTIKSSATNCQNGGPCIDCTQNENYVSCFSDSDEIKRKVDDMIKGKDAQIQQALTDMNNKSTLCERVKCAANWYKTTGKEEFWTKSVQHLWTELSTAMSNNGKKENDDCTQMDGYRPGTHSEKAACNYLYAGLKQLYQPEATTTAGDNDILKKNLSFRQAVGCFLLHSYANKMKKKAVCEIDAGIKKAFDSWRDPSTKATDTCKKDSNGKEPCVSCPWQGDILESCKINGNGVVGTSTENVENKLKTAVIKEDDARIKEMAKVVNEMKFCDRVECVAARWNKQSNGGSSRTHTWNKVWEDDNGVKKELRELSKEIGTNETDKTVTGLCKIDEKSGKDACILIASGLKSLYDIKDKDAGGTDDAVTASFKRTMQCVLLNALADKMKDDLPCKEERNVNAGIEEAFKKSAEIMGQGKGCLNGNDKCFKCSRVPLRTFVLCNLDSKRNTQNVKTEVDKLLDDKNGGQAEMKQIWDKAIKDICKPCTDKGDLCTQLKCIAPKWAVNRHQKEDQGTWSNMENDFKGRLGELLKDMKNTNYQDPEGKYCTAWSDSDAHGFANKTACKLVAAGLQHISKIQESLSTRQHKPYDNQEFKQFASCLMLKAVAQKMKEDSKICDIEPGIKAAFEKAQQIKDANCKNDKPCIVCKWDDKTKDELNACTISNGKGPTVNVKEKLNDVLTKEKKKDVEGTLQELLKTDQPEGVPLCNRLQCIEARVKEQQAQTQGKSNADDFWTEKGEVGKLWNQLAQAVTTNGKTINGTECTTMDDNRQPTEPEKKACQYLTVGFNKLKENLTNDTSTYPILSKDPLLRQTVGCLLLKEYAKKMKGQSKCLIESGIKKAFGSWKVNKSSPCTANSGPCIECNWEDNEYENCNVNITINGKTEIAKTKVQGMVEDGTLSTSMVDINKTQSLCEKLQCATPKWFQNKMKENSSTKKDWCDFWNQGVKPTLEGLFKHIDEEGKKTNSPCKDFGDGNPLSVERKACNHIAAGLDYINRVQVTQNGQSSAKEDDKFFKQSMMCAALNLYATKIRDATDKSCPIGEDKINRMFADWNQQNNPNSSSPNSCSNGVYGCFECKREEKILDGCDLLVDKDLIGTSSQSQSGTCNTDATNVETQMEGLLKDSAINNTMQKTLSNINEMKSSFCTQVQCAIKQKLKIKNGQATSSGTITQPWNALKEDIGRELTALLKNMNDATKQKDVEQYCKNDTNWNNKGHTERRTNRAACLHFAAGLQHIYGRPNGQKKGPVNGPSFGQTMGCLFLKEYAKQLQKVANKKKQGHSWVHPLCSIEDGINYAFKQSKVIMEATPPCKDTNVPNSCFVCKFEEGYNKCKIGNDEIKTNVEPLLQRKQTQMEETLSNTVCPILLTDLLTPFLPLAPVSIGLSAMAYYFWKYFGPLGKGGQRFRRSPAQVSRPSVQEQLLDHVEEAGPHEYQLVKERKPRSAPTRTKRSGRVNRRTIIEIHFEVLDECQKGDTQLNQKDFLELLIREFMESELMEEEQVPKEEVPSLGSVFMV
ncbi:SICAvar type I [Plasmodium knowlesi]|uniref:SICAvar type I n=1 Tax=Plasmodium knowlesi TaxID=5850 RepID=A0A1Y3DNR3_PLAKN|nr:SICAvar type I [Plasmodium knowlesi]